jgi:CheY-like chemotaxis protein/Tfp pilus assembly protein PilZ
MKILLVDDSELFLDLQKSYLQRESFILLTTRSGEEALSLIANDMPDLIVIDLIMPGMDGDAVCREVKANPDTRAIPVVMVSSDDDKSHIERCYSAGCDAFVPKPLKREELLETIDRLILVAKRRHPRIPTHLLAYVTHEGRQFQSWIHTLSSGGLFLEMDPPPETGSVIEIVFPVSGLRGPVRTAAKVRWIGKVRVDGPLGIGVEFTRIGDKEKEAIRLYVEEKLAAVGSLKGFA